MAVPGGAVQAVDPVMEKALAARAEQQARQEALLVRARAELADAARRGLQLALLAVLDEYVDRTTMGQEGDLATATVAGVLVSGGLDWEQRRYYLQLRPLTGDFAWGARCHTAADVGDHLAQLPEAGV